MSNLSKKPFLILHDNESLWEKMEKKIIKKGIKKLKIKPEDAYGEKNEQLIISVSRDRFPPEIQVGGTLILKGPQQQTIPAFVKEVKEDVVLIDLNHPLAGKELTFKVKVVAIN